MRLAESMAKRGFRVITLGVLSTGETVLRRPVILSLDRRPELSIQVFTGENADGDEVDPNVKFGFYSHTMSLFLGIEGRVSRRNNPLVIDWLCYQVERTMCERVKSNEMGWAALPAPEYRALPMTLRKSRRSVRNKDGQPLHWRKLIVKGGYVFTSFFAEEGKGKHHTMTVAERNRQFHVKEHIIMAEARYPNASVAVMPRPAKFDEGDLALYFNDYENSPGEDNFDEPVIVRVIDVDKKTGMARIIPQGEEWPSDEAEEAAVGVAPEFLFPIQKAILEVIYPNERVMQEAAAQELAALPAGTHVPLVFFEGTTTPDYMAMLDSYRKAKNEAEQQKKAPPPPPPEQKQQKPKAKSRGKKKEVTPYDDSIRAEAETGQPDKA